MDTAFFVLSKLAGAGLRAETWIICLLVFGMVARWRGQIRRAWVFSGFGVGLLIALTVLPLGSLLLRPIEAFYPVAPNLSRVDGIVVLGGAEQAGLAQEWGLPQTNEGGERFTEAVALARRFPQAKIVFTGGSGALSDLGRTTAPQADMAQQLFLSLGLELDRMLFESHSRNTAENARNSFALVQPRPDQVWVLVTSAFHMRRAMNSFRVAGWPTPVPWPVDHRAGNLAGSIGWDLARNLQLFNTGIKETVGSIVYDIMGR